MAADKDPLGDRMKLYEMAEAGRRLLPLLPAIARLDGRGFSRFTHGLERPYDRRMSDLMIETTRYLIHETVACCGYTQSDEITLGWYCPDFAQDMFFGGRISKMLSTLAAEASVYFNHRLRDFLPAEFATRLPTFDCRVWNVPNLEEGANAFLWRELDASKNSVSMAARHYYTHGELANRSSREMQELLFQKGVNWNDYPAFFKRGTYLQRRKLTRAFTAEELETLPPMHEARRNPQLVVERTEVAVLDLPPLGKIVNRAAVIFLGEEPRLAERPT
jgi:tRNA(His) 5'-end guanylyltransferase